MKGLHMITFLLTIIGGLNWGLVGIGGLMGSDWNVVHMIVGSMPTLEAVVYTQVVVDMYSSVILKVYQTACLIRDVQTV
jgi:uncharacterized membrane protein YuzA (DUF378 family)